MFDMVIKVKQFYLDIVGKLSSRFGTKSSHFFSQRIIYILKDRFLCTWLDISSALFHVQSLLKFES